MTNIKDSCLDYDIKQKELQINKLIMDSANNRKKIVIYEKQLRKLYLKKEGEEE